MRKSVRQLAILIVLEWSSFSTAHASPLEKELGSATHLRSAIEASALLDAPGGVRALMRQFHRLAHAKGDEILPIVRNGFQKPLQFIELGRSLTDSILALSADHPEKTLLLMAEILAAPRSDKKSSFASPDDLTQGRALANDLLTSISLPDETIARHFSFLMSARALMSSDRWSAASAEMRSISEKISLLARSIDSERGVEVALPTTLRDAVQGSILHFEALPNGRTLIIGGKGDNSYDMHTADIVLDLGGDDRYLFAERADQKEIPHHHYISDLAGDDLYESSVDFSGPGVALYGWSLIDDREGNDRYLSNGNFSMAAGLLGVGIIIDRAGNDLYQNKGPRAGWTQGAGLFGAGVLLDESGDDTYIAEKYSQGCGGPYGFGVLIDSSGNDSYLANGPHHPSAYGDRGVYSAMSQGFGFGIRKYAAGGIGVLLDEGGNDQYQGGEFSQASAYYWGLGILHDLSGNDRYSSGRFGQAAGAHQSLSLLVDGKGDDVYSGTVSSSQAGPWDQSIALLIDQGGNDRYRCGELCQGAAANQSLGILMDTEGRDTYLASETSTVGGAQGAAGSNSYHFDTSGTFSLGLLLDTGGENDSYSTGARNGTSRTARKMDPNSSQDSRIYGLLVDE